MAYQIDDITAVQTPDPLPTDTVSQPGYFTDGDPSDKGLGATFVQAWWLNMVQEELLSICKEAGIAPDKTNNSQVVKAISLLIRSQSNDKLSRTGDTTSGNITYQSATAAAPWAATPQAIFGFEGSRGLGSLWGQLDSASNYQLVLFARNTDGSEKAWDFRAVDGKVATPSGHLLLEADDTGNGRVTVQNIGSASGKTLALLDDVTAEAQRAETVESQLVSGVYGKSDDDIQILGFYYQRGSNLPCVVYKDSNGETHYVTVATYADLQDTLKNYATNNALTAETQRAKEAEADCVSGSFGASLSDGDLKIKGLYYVGSIGTPAVTYYDKDSNKLNYLTMVSQPFLNNALSAETARAEAAENTKLSRFGDTSSGNITFNSGNAYQPWAASPQALFSIGGGLMSLWSQVDGENNIQMLLGGNNPGQPYGIPWVFNQAHKTITSPSGNILLEVAGASQPMKIQSFIATTDNGFTVSFPQAFSGTPTSININALEYNWDVGAKAGTWTPTGFRVSYYSSNTKGAPQQVSIIAIGPA